MLPCTINLKMVVYVRDDARTLSTWRAGRKFLWRHGKKAIKTRRARRELNTGPRALQAHALPLSYRPIFLIF